jgi:hypothetical protein
MLTDSPFASAKGIRPGASVGKLRRRLRGARRVRAAGSVWYLARAGTVALVFKTDRSRVVSVGVGGGSFTSPAAAGLLNALLVRR